MASLKAAKGNLAWWQAALSDFAATALPLRSDHVAEIWSLPASGCGWCPPLAYARGSEESLRN